MNPRIHICAALLGLGMSSASLADFYVYEIDSMDVTDLGTLGGDEALALDINDKSEIVGWSRLGLGIPHGFLYRNSTMTDITTGAGFLAAYPHGINNNTQIVGQYQVPRPEGSGTYPKAFYWSNGEFHVIDPFERASKATSINNFGQIAGSIHGPGGSDSCGGLHAVYWPSAYSTAVSLYCTYFEAADALTAADINDSTTIVGMVTTTSWRLSDGTIWSLPLGTLCEIIASGVNDTGVVVGAGSGCNTGAYQAIYWSNVNANPKVLGVMSGGDFSDANEVNNQNFVAGYSQKAVGRLLTIKDRAFLWHAHFGMQELPVLNGVFTECRAKSLNNRNASTGLVQVVGYCTNAAGKLRAVRWDVVVSKRVTYTPPVEGPIP
ncbi:MAG TPA: hypothetical protein VKB34_13640 [Povalibacter sp.]|nr:hypothetical protein [Povalibacter sp.]